MELYTVLTIVDRAKAAKAQKLYSALSLPLVLTLLGRGTATARQLSLYGLEATEKALLLSIASAEQVRQLLRSARQKLYIDIPGNGILLTVPVKSVGGGRTLAYVSNNAAQDGATPELPFQHELILAVLNEGHTDVVMDAARAAGAAGGTVLHAKGTGALRAEKFLGVSLADEKEVILIVSPAGKKSGIMEAILRQTGPGTPAGAITFSLPISAVAGLRQLEPEA